RVHALNCCLEELFSKIVYPCHLSEVWILGGFTQPRRRIILTKKIYSVGFVLHFASLFATLRSYSASCARMCDSSLLKFLSTRSARTSSPPAASDLKCQYVVKSSINRVASMRRNTALGRNRQASDNRNRSFVPKKNNFMNGSPATTATSNA